ncbi:MAG: prolyl oligopeptidase family serine peptidase [Gemmatimonadota bacterium]
MGLFDDLREYAAIPRVTGLKLSPDGGWLAATVQEVGPEGKKYHTGIWRILVGGDGSGPAVPIRLTSSVDGEGSPEFLPDGSLLFISKRPDPAAAPAPSPEDRKPALWLLPAAGGEARRIIAPPGGVTGLAAAAGVPEVLLTAPMLPGADGADEDSKRREARLDAGVSAILLEAGPLRYWDHDLGPDQLRLIAARVGVNGVEGELRDLTPAPGRALDEQHSELSPDGTVAVSGWNVWEERGELRHEVVAIDTASGARRTLLGAPMTDFTGPRISPDGRQVLCFRSDHETYDVPGDQTLVLVPLEGDAKPTDLLPDLDRWPNGAVWARDSQSVYFTADDNGRCPVFRVDVANSAVTRLTTDDAAYTDLCPAPDGRYLYALRSAMDSPPTPVRIDVTSPGAPPLPLPSPGGKVTVPGRVTEVAAEADDGAVIRGWLVLPENASPNHPVPLLLWVHGGPYGSWNAWSWRWNPWLMAARGYAVLLPDPALSTGYGLNFIARGHGTWGPRPYADIMAITDAVAARPDIDAGRTAMMGGSYGGYMANWIAGQTGRFRAIVSHAGLWALDQMFGTTDLPAYWRRHFGDPLERPERYEANSPHRNAGRITTPMLIIHGDKDYRVPIGEALRLWADLASRSGPESTSKFLYFPDENHWILAPGHAVAWYETILAFLAHHVLGEPWQRPNLL